MDSEYKSISWKSLESNILFIGQDDCPPNYFYRGNNVRQNYVIHYVQEGKGIFSSANHNTVSLQAGDVFILPKGVPCFYQADGEDPWKYFWIGFSGTKINTMLKGSILAKKRYLRQVQQSSFYTSLRKLYDALRAPSSLPNDILVESLTYQMFYNLVTEYPNKREKDSSEANKQMQLAIYYLQENYRNSDCTITSLCHHINISRSYLYTIFKREMNLSPQKYLSQLRMEDAKQLLLNSNNPIQDIAHRVGYKDEFTFSKAFKRYDGFSPQIFRKNIRKN
ncbi:AraC family ligand binding domain-containing protein [Limosilactobacillus sp. RRLNB_1_1]|uniref:AraC family ligand binding domain-containing protein n=1 Tax=Limosilactobacillus albertensis TaxID=2759752 RepID=A0A7W3Y8H2_9LACO|nr:AraC family ligand binding domain-containing protein [Limosilactobacillus albertensis]MBB1070015.1 AraC family ligand binding domain-containing protein [Limosilactobacillus albertensis]MCD7117252.1 AraC family ligand binding domain-containing protein [Limosilactobacillus albertensis]MCD7128856.1 AraC family ligand binding domain-containing protein [Limosilactobacillus albertensis]